MAEYIRVTEVLEYFAEPGLVDWKVKVGKREAKRVGTVATKIGTNVDEWVKAKVLGKKLPKLKSLEAEVCARAYQQWVKDYSPKLEVGVRLYSDTFGISGEPDLYWGDTVVDIKCSREIRPNYWLQTAAYCKLARKSKRAILRLDKVLGEYEYKTEDSYAGDWVVYLGLLAAYRFYNPPVEEESRVGNASDNITGKEDSSRQVVVLPEDVDDRPSQGRQV